MTSSASFSPSSPFRGSRDGRVGTNGVADRDALIAHLRRLADGDDGYY